MLRSRRGRWLHIFSMDSVWNMTISSTSLYIDSPFQPLSRHDRSWSSKKNVSAKEGNQIHHMTTHHHLLKPWFLQKRPLIISHNNRSINNTLIKTEDEVEAEIVAEAGANSINPGLNTTSGPVHTGRMVIRCGLRNNSTHGLIYRSRRFNNKVSSVPDHNGSNNKVNQQSVEAKSMNQHQNLMQPSILWHPSIPPTTSGTWTLARLLTYPIRQVILSLL